MNTLINTIYFNLLAKLNPVDAHEEEGAEAIEWIAMVAVILILLIFLRDQFDQQGQTFATTIWNAVMDWINRFM